jgi:multiple sugar transport system ATP-binding protein
MMATLTLNNIAKHFNGQTIIPGLDLTIHHGEFIALVGPSGCGKSTLLRMIAGLEGIDGGELILDGEVINDLSPQERNMAMVFQNYALYPHMTVADNLGFSLKMQGVAKAKIDSQVRQAADTLGLTPLARKPSQLSGGSASAWQWAAPSCAIRACSCLMSRSLTSTPNCAWSCALKSRRCISGLTPP